MYNPTVWLIGASLMYFVLIPFANGIKLLFETKFGIEIFLYYRAARIDEAVRWLHYQEEWDRLLEYQRNDWESHRPPHLLTQTTGEEYRRLNRPVSKLAGLQRTQ